MDDSFLNNVMAGVERIKNNLEIMDKIKNETPQAFIAE